MTLTDAVTDAVIEFLGWDRCDHSGIGRLGCPTCDPDKSRCLARAEIQRIRAVASEREACAKLAEAEAGAEQSDWTNQNAAHGRHDGCKRVATAIRARGTPRELTNSRRGPDRSRK